MTKSKHRGPRKIGRTRKARSRRYGGAAAFDETLRATGTATLLSNFVENMDIKSVHDSIPSESFYKTISDLAKAIKAIEPNNNNKAIQIVALLILVNYHIDNGVIDTLNTTFNNIVGKIKENKGKDLNSSIEGLNTSVLNTTGENAIMDQANILKLKTYVEDVLRRLSGETQATNATQVPNTPQATNGTQR